MRTRSSSTAVCGALGALALGLLSLLAHLGLEHRASAQRAAREHREAEEEGQPEEVGGPRTRPPRVSVRNRLGTSTSSAVRSRARVGVTADGIEEEQQAYERRGAVLRHEAVQERLEHGRDGEDHGPTSASRRRNARPDRAMRPPRSSQGGCGPPDRSESNSTAATAMNTAAIAMSSLKGSTA